MISKTQFRGRPRKKPQGWGEGKTKLDVQTGGGGGVGGTKKVCFMALRGKKVNDRVQNLENKSMAKMLRENVLHSTKLFFFLGK